MLFKPTLNETYIGKTTSFVNGEFQKAPKLVNWTIINEKVSSNNNEFFFILIDMIRR